jgi:hypothetical protein
MSEENLALGVYKEEGHPFRWPWGLTMTFALRMMSCILLAFALGACNAPVGDVDGTSAMQLKLYRVPADQSKTIAKDLGAVLESSEFQLGTKAHTEMRVTQPFPGTVMVLAPAPLQSSIASAIDEMSKTSGKQVANAPDSVPLRVQFWTVQANAGAGDDTAALSDLQPTLKRIRDSLGPSHFVLEDTASVLVDAPNHFDPTQGNGKLSSARGHNFVFRALAMAGGKISLDVNYANATRYAADHSIPELNTTVTVDPNTYVVLAEAAPPLSTTAAPNPTLMNLLVVRVDRIAPVSH